MISVAAVSETWGIGRNNALLFSIPEDMRHFRELTAGGVVIMGRKTFESLPGKRPLKGRVNLILSRSPSFVPPEGAEIVPDVPSLMEKIAAHPPDRVFVIGGEEVYRLLLPYCSRVEITKVEADPPADCLFPNLDQLPGWRKAREEPPMEHDGIRFRYVTYLKAE